MNPPLKIVHLITRLDSGGSAESTFLTARELRKKGYETAIWAGTGFDLPREIESEAAAAGIPLVFIPSLVRSVRPWKDLQAFFAIRSLLKKEKPDILHTHTSKAGFLGRLAGWLSGVPAIIHTPHGHVFYGYFGPVKTWFYIFLERLAARWTDIIVPLTRRGIEEHLARKIGRPEQYAAIPDGVDFSGLAYSPRLREEVRRRYGVPDPFPVVGSVGRFVPIKGFDLIVEAAPQVLREFPSATFYLGGVGPLKEKCRQRTRELGIENKVIFDEFQEVLRPLHLLDIFLLPSRNEGMSRTLLEAMGLKRAVVASAVGGIPDVIREGKTGLLVAPDHPEALAKAILKLLKNPELRQQMGEAAAQEARQRFTLEKMIGALEEVYQQVLVKKKKVK